MGFRVRYLLDGPAAGTACIDKLVNGVYNGTPGILHGSVNEHLGYSGDFNAGSDQTMTVQIVDIDGVSTLRLTMNANVERTSGEPTAMDVALETGLYINGDRTKFFFGVSGINDPGSSTTLEESFDITVNSINRTLVDLGGTAATDGSEAGGYKIYTGNIGEVLTNVGADGSLDLISRNGANIVTGAVAVNQTLFDLSKGMELEYRTLADSPFTMTGLFDWLPLMFYAAGTSTPAPSKYLGVSGLAGFRLRVTQNSADMGGVRIDSTSAAGADTNDRLAYERVDMGYDAPFNGIFTPGEIPFSDVYEGKFGPMSVQKASLKVENGNLIITVNGKTQSIALTAIGLSADQKLFYFGVCPGGKAGVNVDSGIRVKAEQVYDYNDFIPELRKKLLKLDYNRGFDKYFDVDKNTAVDICDLLTMLKDRT